MGGMHFLGLIVVWALVAVEGQLQQISYQGDNQVLAGSQNLPTTPQSILQTPQQAERRLSLEDFFMNSPQQQQPAAAAAQQPIQQLPLPQFQVQQSDPNSLMLVRDAQFPSQNGGLVSRLLMLRRMMRLRRWARRLSFIPRLVRLGVRSTQLRQEASEPQPVILANNRVGRTYNDEPYDPRDYVLGNKGFSYNNTPSSQENYYSRDQPKQDANTNSREVNPYYDTVNDLPYDLYDNKNTNGDDSSLENQNKYYKDTTNSNNNDDRQLQSYDVAKNLQQKLMQNMQQQYSNYPKSNQNPSFGSQQNEILNGNIYSPNNQKDSYKKNKQVYQNTKQQDNYRQNPKFEDNSNQHDKSAESNSYQGQNEHQQQQLQKLHQQQLQLLSEQQLLQLLREQQILVERERQLQLQQQGINLHQQQNQNQQPQIESEAPASNYPAQTYTQPQLKSYDQTENNGYEKPLISNTNNVGSATRIGSDGNIFGVGGIKPPAVGISVTNPVSSVIKPLPSIVNPVLPKAIPAAAAAEQIVPLGFLPRPMLNLNGRVFFGAEVGKGVRAGGR